MQIMSIYCLEQKKSMMNPQKIYRKEKSLNIKNKYLNIEYYLLCHFLFKYLKGLCSEKHNYVIFV